MRELLPLGALLVLGIVLMPFFQGYGASAIPDGGTDIMGVRHDVQGNIVSYSPGHRYLSLPLRINIDAGHGEYGHISYGVFGLTESPPKGVGFVVSLDHADALIDKGMNRIALATGWVGGDRTYYLEFDIWDSPGTVGVFNPTTLIYAEDGGGMPTIEVKMAQIEGGETGEFYLDLDKEFDKVWGDVEADLYSVYLVIEKTSPDSSLSAEITLDRFILFD